MNNPMDVGVAPITVGNPDEANPHELFVRGLRLRVEAFRGRESISKPYRFDIDAITDSEVQAASLLAEPARLVTHISASSSRVVAGVVASAEPAFTPGRGGLARLRVRLVPRLSLLRLRGTSRVFQDLSVQGIVSRVLEGAGVEHGWKLRKPGGARAYCLQYQETDFEFVSRLLAEEGIFYWFSQPELADLDGKEQVIFADAAQAYESLPGGEDLALRAYGAAWTASDTDDDIFRFQRRSAVRSSRVYLRDYDFRRPLLKLESDAEVAEGPKLERYHHRGDYDAPEVTKARAQAELEQHRRSAVVGSGEGACRRLAPGYAVRVAVESDPSLDGAYAITKVRHEGVDPRAAKDARDIYKNTFECVPRDVAFRPARPDRKLHQVLESATVVGPEGEEIHTDELGRIKIQFHWDLEGKRDEQSSCWIRVAQTWSGATWGFQFIPRIGMEVMVTFLGGDQDCPVVIGCVPNATHPVPFRLPEHKTRSGIRTRSTPASNGANEISFEDTAGEEELLVIAQKDHVVEVKNDHTLSVAAQQKVTVGANQDIGVTGDRLVTVGGSRTEVVRGDASTKVEGSQSVKVDDDRRVVVGGALATQVKADLDLTIDGRGTLAIGTKDTPSVGAVDAHGDVTVSATGSVRITAAKSIRLRVGESVIEVGPEEIKLESKAITIIGKSSVSAVGKGPQLHLTDKAVFDAKAITIKTPEAFLKLEKDASLNGKLVKLNCDTVDDGDDPEEKKEKPKSFRVKVADDFQKPYADKPYELVVEGTALEGTTTGDGMVEQDVPPTAQTGVLTVWLKEKGKSPKLTFQLKLGDLAPLDTPLGVRTRLKNLGYLRTVEKQSEGVEIEAIRAFQRDHALEPTGVVDDETKAKLADTHGH